jgi:hypothetical protein
MITAYCHAGSMWKNDQIQLESMSRVYPMFSLLDHSLLNDDDLLNLSKTRDSAVLEGFPIMISNPKNEFFDTSMMLQKDDDQTCPSPERTFSSVGYHGISYNVVRD